MKVNFQVSISVVFLLLILAFRANTGLARGEHDLSGVLTGAPVDTVGGRAATTTASDAENECKTLRLTTAQVILPLPQLTPIDVHYPKSIAHGVAYTKYQDPAGTFYVKNYLPGVRPETPMGYRVSDGPKRYVSEEWAPLTKSEIDIQAQDWIAYSAKQHAARNKKVGETGGNPYGDLKERWERGSQVHEQKLAKLTKTLHDREADNDAKRVEMERWLKTQPDGGRALRNSPYLAEPKTSGGFSPNQLASLIDAYNARIRALTDDERTVNEYRQRTLAWENDGAIQLHREIDSHRFALVCYWRRLLARLP